MRPPVADRPLPFALALEKAVSVSSQFFNAGARFGRGDSRQRRQGSPPAVTRGVRQPHRLSRPIFLMLAALAIALKVMFPPGFMAAPPSNDLPFAIVLCTGQGPVTVGAGHALPEHVGHAGEKQAPSQSAQDSPCAFAGHGAAAAPPTLQGAERAQFVVYQVLAVVSPPSFAPGRGLAGPPLPARGPPVLLV